ncbi:hypothetical protein [Lentzea sp.]|uniref:hypothetical protein n=1 Tax=Lentzea sp. TaxID=56099 RepID=UPI002ED3E285
MLRRSNSSRFANVTMAAVLGAAFTVGLLVSSPTAAHAEKKCHGGGWPVLGYGEVKYDNPGGSGDLKYPASLHGRTARLYSGRSNAAAYARVYLTRGDVLGIDRSNFTVTGPGSDHNWLRTDEVEARGTWDYCEVTATSDATYDTPVIDGAHRAVRICLLHNGGRQCTNIWYADNDDD